MRQCHGSGDVSGYLASLKQESKTAQQQNTREWKALQGRGAVSGDVEVYTTDPHTCSGAFASDPHARAAFSYVVEYKDSKSASKSFSAGFLGLQPRQGQQAPGLAEGDATGLGSNSWSYTQTKSGTSVFLAYWQQKDFTIFLGTTNLPAQDSQKAAAAMNGRVS